jgi:hypothetical protein
VLPAERERARDRGGDRPGGRDAERRRTRGARILLQHLDGFPGQTWQQRWEVSGLNESDRPVNVMIPGYEGRREVCTGMACLLSLRVIRPSLRALRSTRFHGYGQRFLTAQRDPLLEDFWNRVQSHPVHTMHHTAALFDVAVTLTTQGIALAGLTPEAFLHYVWQSRDQGLNMKARGKQNRGQFAGQLAWPVLHEMGLFPPGTPPTVRAAVLTGRRTLEELVDRPDPAPGSPPADSRLPGAAQERAGLQLTRSACPVTRRLVLGQDRGPGSRAS